MASSCIADELKNDFLNGAKSCWVLCACVQTRIMSCYSEDLYGRRNKMFHRNLVLPFIFCGLRFLGWYLICVGFNVLCSFCGIRKIISGMLVMIGHVREIRHLYWYAVPTSEDFLKVIIIWSLCEMWTGFVWPLIGSVGSYGEHCNVSSDYVRFW